MKYLEMSIFLLLSGLRKIKLFLMGLILVNLSACNYSPSRGFTGDVRISADGSVVGIVEWDNSGAKLRLKKVNSTLAEWQEVRLPQRTGSFNFSQTGQAVLITYRDGENGVFAKISLDGANKLTEIYRSDLGLAFPTEMSPENYLIQAVSRITPNGYPIHKWKVISPARTVIAVSKEFGPPYSNVNLVGDSGFFIVTGDIKEKDRVRAFALPDGSAPSIEQYLAAETTDLTCDRTLNNCIQLNRFTEAHQFFFKLVRLHNSQKCELTGFPRWNERVAMTPNGKHALVVSSKDPQTRPVINVLTFSDSVCTDFIKTTMEF